MDHVFSKEALEFVSNLVERFEKRRNELLLLRKQNDLKLANGELLNFLPESESIRNSDWKVAPIPSDLQDRRVEITGPVERKMIINALNSGAKVFMADFEDSLSPTKEAVIQGQINLYDAIRRTISYTNEQGKEYKLNDNTAVLIVRPRGWHLDEKFITINNKPVPAALMDFGIYFFNNAKALIENGTGPYFYLPKLEHYKEAQLWADIFKFSENYLDLPKGTIKATVLIETINAAFQMDEILYILRDYCVGLNCGRWDYIFSFIKKFNNRDDFVLPDRMQVTMTKHFLRSYSQLLIKTTHKRGAFAMGGMSAFIPVKNNPEANEKAFAMVKADKEREANDGHDGTWVAHPGLIPVAKEVFDRLMPGKNQLHIKRDDVEITAMDLLEIPAGEITEQGLRNNINVSLQYIASWLSGNGCVPINNLMEDAATAEIARSQVWQWLHHNKITVELFEKTLQEEHAAVKEQLGQRYNEKLYAESEKLLRDLILNKNFAEFLTLGGYDRL